MNKTLKRILCILLILIVAAAGVGYAVFHSEIATLAALKQEQSNFYVLDYKADYGLEEFMKQGATTDAQLARFIVGKLLKGLPVTLDIPELGCSTFNAATPEGDCIFGRNFDNFDADFALVHTKPAHGYESLSMANLSFVGFNGKSLTGKALALAAPYIPLDGVNEKGLSIGVLQVYTDETNQDTGKVDVTTTAAIRILLDTCATVEEAIETLKGYDMHSSAGAPYHFQIADATGDSATVEYIDNELVVDRSPLGAQCTTNFILAEGKYQNEGYGQDRFETMRETLSKSENVLTEAEGMELLRAVHQENLEFDGVIVNTQWSCLYNNTDRTLDLCVNQDYDNVYRFSLDGSRR